MIGLTGFASASALGGAAADPAMLFTSRALQAARAASVHGLDVASLGAAGFLCAAAPAVFLITGPKTAKR